MQKIIVILVLIIILVLGAFLFFRSSNKSENTQTNTTQQITPSEKTGLVNPASVNCVNQGGKLDIVTEASSGGQIGICNFPDGRSCEEWDFFRTKICTSTKSAQQQ